MKRNIIISRDICIIVQCFLSTSHFNPRELSHFSCPFCNPLGSLLRLFVTELSVFVTSWDIHFIQRNKAEYSCKLWILGKCHLNLFKNLFKHQGILLMLIFIQIFLKEFFCKGQKKLSSVTFSQEKSLRSKKT